MTNDCTRATSRSTQIPAGKCDQANDISPFQRFRSSANVGGIVLIVYLVLGVLGGGGAMAFVAYKKGWVGKQGGGGREADRQRGSSEVPRAMM